MFSFVIKDELNFPDSSITELIRITEKKLINSSKLDIHTSYLVMIDMDRQFSTACLIRNESTKGDKKDSLQCLSAYNTIVFKTKPSHYKSS